uniref:ANK_REP_REGION domain-containing protein n=1 Tax=Globodera pallida TaxID=36090 RepID=A0A183CNG7_GLOPA
MYLGLQAGFLPLFFAASQGHLEVCRELVAKGADVNQSNNGRTPWLEACANGHLDIVEFFMGNGQGIEARNKNGVTGLIAACLEGKANVVQFLLSKGARTDWATAKGFTAMDKAVAKRHGEIMLILALHESARN